MYITEVILNLLLQNTQQDNNSTDRLERQF